METPLGDPCVNMAIDEFCLLQASRNGQVFLRLYTWSVPTLSLGYFQETGKEVDLGFLEERGMALVRRLTGGRAVLHDDELTYSFAAPVSHPVFGGDLQATYLRLAGALAASLGILGIQAEVCRGRGGGKSFLCFDAPSRYEITWRGKKLIGSAQVRKRGAYLQHGSIPLTMDRALLAEVIKNAGPAESLLGQAVALREIDPALNLSALREALIKGFTSSLRISLRKFDLFTHEEEIRHLVLKYRSREWNFKERKVGSSGERL